VELLWRGTLAREEVKMETQLSCGSQTVRGGWSALVILIQYFGFGSRGNVMG
jgi:hypothetical protein